MKQEENLTALRILSTAKDSSRPGFICWWLIAFRQGLPALVTSTNLQLFREIGYVT